MNAENTSVQEAGQDIINNQPVNQLGEELPQEVEASAPENNEETRQAGNFRRLREQKDSVERERDEALRRLQELELAQKPVAPEEDLEIDFQEDDLIEGKHLKKILKRQEKLEKELKTYKQQYTKESADVKLKSQYPDLEKVLSQDNIKSFERDHPELSYSISNNPDEYSKWVSAYKAIKQFGIYQEDKFSADRVQTEANAKKPRPLSSVSPQQGNSPLTRANAFANGLTPELRKSLLQEMQEARKAY